MPGEDRLSGARTLTEVFAASTVRYPGRVALRDPDRTLTYAELDRRSRALGDRLAASGVRPGDWVGLLLDRTVDVGVAVLGVLRSGAGYVPLDPALPAARIAEILADAAVDVIVTEPGLPATPGVTRVEVSVRNDVAATVPGVPDPTPSSPAYAIYTSGSTGRPKGVVVTHANVVALLRHALPLYDVRETDVWSLFHSYGFDFSVWELWGALATGAECFVVPLAVAQSPESTLRMLAERRVTVLNQVPSVFARFVDAFVSAGAPALSLRYVIFGGEAVNLAAADRFGELAAATGRRPPVLVNMYGITET
ncbi:AMP-binding protein, partial [Amycolatopsis sp. NPDC000746]